MPSSGAAISAVFSSHSPTGSSKPSYNTTLHMNTLCAESLFAQVFSYGLLQTTLQHHSENLYFACIKLVCTHRGKVHNTLVHITPLSPHSPTGSFKPSYNTAVHTNTLCARFYFVCTHREKLPNTAVHITTLSAQTKGRRALQQYSTFRLCSSVNKTSCRVLQLLLQPQPLTQHLNQHHHHLHQHHQHPHQHHYDIDLHLHQ